MLFTRPDVVDGAPDLFRPSAIWPLGGVLDEARRRNPAQRYADRFTRWIDGRLKPHTGRGYVRRDKHGRVASILPGHAMAIGLFALSFAAYLLLGVLDFLRLRSGEPPLVPTLSNVMLLVMLLCWLFSGLAFFLDRYRVPVLVPVLVWLGLTAYAPWSDYFYPVTERGQATRGVQSVASPDGEAAEESIIVVAANGGGIQAAAWTARVLTGLEQECRNTLSCGEEFGKSIRLISSVSGGSVGTMYFVNEYAGGNLPRDDELDDIVKRAERSSLDEIAWGVFYPDLVRTVLPIPLRWDRGRALEEAWLRSDASWPRSGGIREGLSAWRRDTQLGGRPAVIFNTTIAETGERLPLATTQPPERSPGRVSYDQLFGDAKESPNIAVVTAARLSASFPYVSPAARADVEGQAPHIVDGGYYDNYGISSLVEWLDEQLERKDNEVREVLIIEVRGAPTGIRPANDEDCPTTSVSGYDRKSDRGWFFQAFAPALTVLNVRDAGQRTHNEVELCLLIDKWKAEAEGVEITRAVFEYDGGITPLSWHLTNEDKEAIQKNWEAELTKERNKRHGWNKVRNFLTNQAGRNP